MKPIGYKKPKGTVFTIAIVVKTRCKELALADSVTLHTLIHFKSVKTNINAKVEAFKPVSDAKSFIWRLCVFWVFHQ